jgi:hypothetical protein
MGEPWWEYNRKVRTVVRGSKFFTVPKKATARRGCCSEPMLNSYVQLGIGRYIAKRLSFYGVDLNDQRGNQDMAEKAYTKKLATLDLSNASDLMSRAVVSELVSYEWDHLLSLARSPSTFVDGEWVELAKHSSMGNGYTFPLETTIFKAVMDSCVPIEDRHNTSVYGDDIIVPQCNAQSVIDRLEYLGFQVNRTKSHLAGDFFESCGKDFFRGDPVRPFYARREKEGIVPIPYQLQLANALRLYASMRGKGDCDSRFRPIWEDLVNAVPTPWRSCRVPKHFGDVGLITSLEESGCPKAWHWKQSQLEGHVVRFVHLPAPKRDRRSFGVLLAATERGVAGNDFSQGREAPRASYGKPLVRKAVTEWPPGLAWD